MEFMKWIELAISFLSALLVIIPLGVKLYKTVEELVRQRNWPRIVEAVVDYMADAELMFTTGADRKTWVMAMIQQTAIQLNYTMRPEDIANIGDLIDRMCDMATIVNSDLTIGEVEEDKEG